MGLIYGGIKMQSRNFTFSIFRNATAIVLTTLLFVNLSYAEQHAKHETHKKQQTSSLNVALHTEPHKIEAGKPATLMFKLTDAMGEPFTDLMIHHDRVLHVLIVSENLQIIGHVHPEDFDSRDMMAELEGTYTVHFTFPVAGRYILALDVMTSDEEFAEYLYVDVEGEKKMADIAEDLRTEKTVFGYTEEGGDRFSKAVSITDENGTSKYHVKIKVPEQIKVGEMVHITYHFSRDGKPIDNLVPFLDAPMHFAIVSTRLDGILHTHGTVPMNSDKGKMAKKDPHAGHKMKKEATTGHQHQGTTPDKFGPTVMLMTTFPKAGRYQIFGQLKHDDQILFPTFMVEVVD